ncbi:MAG: hypothetical protein M3092_01000, partial [Actinomycetia bacterium]|nr:hypothetical protein [Actinomycetes bacterium]
PCRMWMPPSIPWGSRYGLSLGDRVGVATAAEFGVPAVTADRVWSNLDVGDVESLDGGTRRVRDRNTMVLGRARAIDALSRFNW